MIQMTFNQGAPLLSDVLTDHMFLDNVLSPSINAGEAMAFVSFLMKQNREDLAFGLAKSWAERDEDITIETDGNKTTIRDSLGDLLLTIIDERKEES